MKGYNKTLLKKVMASDRKYTSNEQKLGQYLSYADANGGDISIDMNTVLDMLGISKKDRKANNDDDDNLPFTFGEFTFDKRTKQEKDYDDECKKATEAEDIMLPWEDIGEDRDPLNLKKGICDNDLTDEERKALTKTTVEYYKNKTERQKQESPRKIQEPIKVKNPATSTVIYSFRIPVEKLVTPILKEDGLYYDEDGNMIRDSYVYYELNNIDGFYYNTEDEDDVKSIDQLLMMM